MSIILTMGTTNRLTYACPQISHIIVNTRIPFRHSTTSLFDVFSNENNRNPFEYIENDDTQFDGISV